MTGTGSEGIFLQFHSQIIKALRRWWWRRWPRSLFPRHLLTSPKLCSKIIWYKKCIHLQRSDVYASKITFVKMKNDIIEYVMSWLFSKTCAYHLDFPSPCCCCLINSSFPRLIFCWETFHKNDQSLQLPRRLENATEI